MCHAHGQELAHGHGEGHFHLIVRAADRPQRHTNKQQFTDTRTHRQMDYTVPKECHLLRQFSS